MTISKKLLLVAAGILLVTITALAVASATRGNRNEEAITTITTGESCVPGQSELPQTDEMSSDGRLGYMMRGPAGMMDDDDEHETGSAPSCNEGYRGAGQGSRR